MKCLSVKQPWAALLLHGIKDIENRTWKTDYRGMLLIHASTKLDKIKIDDIIHEEKITHELRKTSEMLGKILGAMDLKGIVKPDEWLKSGWHENEYWGWYMEPIKIFINPIPCRGKLGLWELGQNEIDLVSKEISTSGGTVDAIVC